MTGLRGLDNGERAVLALAEVQKRVVEPAFSTSPIAIEAEQRGIVAKIAALADACRAAGVPVVHCHKDTRPDLGGNFNNCLLHAASNRRPLPDNLEEVLSSSVPVLPADYMIRKVHGVTSFHNTELESIMRYYAATTLILAGVSTDMNIAGTSIEAVNRGFNVVLVEDCTAGSSPEVHRFQVEHMLRLLTTISDSATVMGVLQQRSSS
jgi:nicotinamidase-related amidase